MELLKSGEENATAGLNSQIKGTSAPFSFCFDKKIADYSQFICLCPLLIPGAVKRWLKSSRWWDRITPEHLYKTGQSTVHAYCLSEKKRGELSSHEQSVVPLKNTSALQAQQVQISPRTRKEKKHTNTLNTLQSCQWNLDFNEPEGRNGGNTRCINAPVSPDQTSENLRRSQQEGRLLQS